MVNKPRGFPSYPTSGLAEPALVVHVFWVAAQAMVSPHVLPQNVLLLGVVMTDVAFPSHQQVNHLHMHLQYPKTGSFKTTLRADCDIFSTDICHFQTFIINSTRFLFTIIRFKVTLADIFGNLQLNIESFANLLITG